MRAVQWAGLFMAVSPVLMSSVASAAPSDYVVMPIVEEGEKEVDLKWGAAKMRDGSSGTASSVGLGWGANSWWFLEGYAKWHREPGEKQVFDAWEVENRFQLTETGKYFMDVGVLLEIERPQDRTEGYEITYGPLFQKEWGELQGNLNLLLQRHVRSAEPSPTEMLYQWQLKWRGSEHLEFGAQGLGNLGRWDHWASSADQSHQLGPAVFGKLKLGGHQAIKYNAAWLFGTNNNTPRHTLRVQAEYEF